MKKIGMGIIIFLMLNLISMHTVLASTKIDAKLVSNTTELKPGDQVEITFRLLSFEEIKKGINAYKATLEYDKNIFEEIVQSNFACQDYWEELKYNSSNGQFVAFRKAKAMNQTDVVKITLKVKKGVEATKTIVKVKDITTSEGKGDIKIKDTSVLLNIIKEQQTIPTKPVVPEKPNTDNSTTTNKKPTTSGNVVGAPMGDATKPNEDTNIEDTNHSQKPEEDLNDTDVEKPTKPIEDDEKQDHQPGVCQEKCVSC